MYTFNLLLFIVSHWQIVQAFLPAPVNLNASAEATSITLVWKQPLQGVDDVDNYDISYNYTIHECKGESGASNFSTINVTLSGSLRNYTIQNSFATPVEEDSTCIISLVATNRSTGKRSEASTVTVTTHTAPPSGPPQYLRVISSALSNITIQWDEVSCLQRNGPISKYIITITGPYYWAPMEEPICYAKTKNRVYTVLGLQPHSTYTVTVRAVSSDNHYFLHPGLSASLNINTTTPLDVGILLLGHLYNNNSIVNIDEIGEGSNSLLCLTSNTQCCRPYDLWWLNFTTYPHWYFPNGSYVRHFSSEDSLYRNRGPSVVRLHRRNSTIVLSGVFHCTIPDINRTIQTIYVGIYSLKNGSPTITSLLFDGNTTTLVCTSTGGPPTTVTWRRNDALVDESLYWQTQIVTDSVTATYDTILGADEMSDFAGTFTCEVSNIRGASQQTLRLVDVSAPSVIINTPIGSFYIGFTSLTLTCVISLNSTTDIDVRPEDLDITWFRGSTALSHNDSKVTISNTRGSKLEFISNLTLSPLSHMDTTFTCRARVVPLRRTNFITHSEAGLFVKAITIQVMPPQMPLVEQLSMNQPAFRVSWDPPLGAGSSESSITYNVSCQSIIRGIDSPSPITTAPGQTNAVIANLAYGVTYNCSIIAQLSQKLIVSQPAYISNTTVEIEPSSSPQEYVATNISSRTVQFSWHPPAVTERNGVITNYTLDCNPKVDGVASITKIFVDAGSHTLGGFRPATEYNCSVFASNAAGNSPKATIITIITQDESTFFQIRLIGLDSCPQWVGDRTDEKAEDITLSVISAVQQYCHCGFVHDRTTDGVFKCFLDSPQAVIYRAVLRGTANATSTELISHIEQWIAKEPTVTVQRVLLTIDGLCGVAISSLTDKGECLSIQSQNPSSHESNIEIIIGGLLSLVIIMIIAAIVIVSFVLLRKHCAANKLQNNRVSKQGAVETCDLNTKEDEHETGKEVHADHEYEMLESYNQMYDEVRCADIPRSGNFNFSKCPAYVPVATSQPTGTQMAEGHTM